MLTLLLGLGAALAADWPMLQGTEPADAPALRPWGFVQVLGEAVVRGPPVEGLSGEALAPFNGERASFNRVGAGAATWGASIRRARAGLRGAAPGTEGRVSYLLAAEFGQNQLTRLDAVVLTDASVTFRFLPGLSLRAGQFKLPLSEEALEMNPLASAFVNYTSAASQLLMENPSEEGAYTAGGSGFRDVGLSAFETFSLGQGALSYALMLSNGQRGSLELDNAKDLSGRISWAPVVWGGARDVQREELSLYAFWQQGPRAVDGEAATRIRRGAGAQIQRAGWRARLEAVSASGALELGNNPPFPGQPVVVHAEGEAVGGSAFVYYQRGLLGGGLRYDGLWRHIDAPADLRIFHTATLNLTLEPTPRTRVLLDYAARRLAAPEASADTQRVAETMGDRLSLQAGAVF